MLTQVTPVNVVIAFDGTCIYLHSKAFTPICHISISNTMSMCQYSCTEMIVVHKIVTQIHSHLL